MAYRIVHYGTGRNASWASVGPEMTFEEIRCLAAQGEIDARTWVRDTERRYDFQVYQMKALRVFLKPRWHLLPIPPRDRDQ